MQRRCVRFLGRGFVESWRLVLLLDQGTRAPAPLRLDLGRMPLGRDGWGNLEPSTPLLRYQHRRGGGFHCYLSIFKQVTCTRARDISSPSSQNDSVCHIPKSHPPRLLSRSVGDPGGRYVLHDQFQFSILPGPSYTQIHELGALGTHWYANSPSGTKYCHARGR